MVIITENKTEQKEKYCKNAYLFTEFTGIKLYFTEGTRGKTFCSPCTTCAHHCSFFQKGPIIFPCNKQCGIFFCPAGYCYLALLTETTSQKISYYISAPILCGEDSKISKLNGTITKGPGEIAKCSSLMEALLAEKHNQPDLIDTFSEGLLTAIANNQAPVAKNIIDRSLEIILGANGHNIEQMKADVIRFIFLLYKIMDEYNHLHEKSSWATKDTLGLMQAKNIGELKSCIDKAGKLFLQKLFHPAFCKHHQSIQKSLAIIEQKYATKLSQNQVAHAVFLSPSHFSKIFNEALGMSFNQYLNQIRIEKAKELLMLPAANINFIHAAVGFESRSYFGKVFKACTGTTPLQYKKQQTAP